MVDTLGFNDTVSNDTDMLASLGDWMEDSFDDGSVLSGIIYLHSISEARLTEERLSVSF